MRSFRHSPNDEGFTLIETAVASLAFAAVGLILAVMFSSSFRVALASREEAMTAARAVLFDEAARAAIGSIEPPFWACGFKPAADKAGMSIPYAAGRPDAFVRLTGGNGGLVLDANGISREFSGIELLEASLIERGGIAIGISLRYGARRRIYETRACFSSFPLGVDDAP